MTSRTFFIAVLVVIVFGSGYIFFKNQQYNPSLPQQQPETVVMASASTTYVYQPVFLGAKNPSTTDIREEFDGPIDTSGFGARINLQLGLESLEFISPQGKHFSIPSDVSKKLSGLTSDVIPVVPGYPNLILLANHIFLGGILTENQLYEEQEACKFENKLYTYNLDTGELSLIYEENQNNLRSGDFRWCRKMKIEGMAGTKLVLGYRTLESSGGPCDSVDILFIDNRHLGLLDTADVSRGVINVSPSDAKQAEAWEKLRECQNSPDI